MLTSEEVERIRENFPTLKDLVHLSAAAVSPMPLPSIRAVEDGLRKLYLEWDWSWEEEVEEECKESIGRLINAGKDEIALIGSTTDGINAIATGISWKEGDNVVLDDLEYPANVIPWHHQARKHGVEVRVVKNVEGALSEESFGELIDDKTRVVAVSHVQFMNGFKVDLKELSKMAHEVGAILFVDAIQSAGAVKLDVREMGVDAMSAGGYKWLCGPVGTGFLYVSKQVLEEIVPAYVGFSGIEESRELWFKIVTSLGYFGEYRNLSRTARRFEYVFKNPALIAGLRSSVEYLMGIGIERIEARIGKLVDYLMKRIMEEGYDTITPLDRRRRAGIVNFNPRIDLRKEENVEKLVKKLRSEKIVITVRGGGIRACCHFFNKTEEVDRLLDAIKRISG